MLNWIMEVENSLQIGAVPVRLGMCNSLSKISGICSSAKKFCNHYMQHRITVRQVF